MAENGGGSLNTMFMGTESLSRRKSQEARNRRESNTRRQDSQERGYYIRYDTHHSYSHKGRLQSQNDRAGEFYRERSQSRSRYGQFNWGQSGNRTKNKNKEKTIFLDVLHVHIAFVRREG